MKTKASVLQQFILLMGNASFLDWCWLADYDRRKSLLLEFNYEKCSVHAAQEVPWPIVWLLSRYSRRFIFVAGKIPKAVDYVKDLTLFGKKIAWRWVFRNEAGSTRLVKNKYKKEMQWPDACIAPEIDLITGAVRTAVLDAVRKANAIANVRKTSRSNRPPVVRVAERLLSSMAVTPVANDKDSGYSLVKDHDLEKVLTDILNTDRYAVISKEKLKSLEAILNSRVFGQANVLKKIADAIKVSRIGQRNGNKPQAAFLIMGPSGVGKTEASKAYIKAVERIENNGRC